MIHYTFDSSGIQIDLRDEADQMIMIDGEWVLAQDAPPLMITEGDVPVWEVEADADVLPPEDEDHLYDPDFPFGH